MGAVVTSLLLALGQLADPRVLRILAKSLAVTVVLFAAVAWAGWHALDRLLEAAGLGDASFAGAEGVRGLASLVLALIGLWLAWRVVAMAVIEFFADEVVQAVEGRHYPQAALTARDLPLGEQLSTSLKSALRALLVNLVALPFALVLLVTGVGTALLFWLVNAVLVGRELQQMVWLRHRRDAADPAPVGRAERFLLGGAIAALLALPGVNLLAPILGAAAATHLIHRKDRA
ncbi:MAG TPA: EI24 domain-containing protein [Croceibacterium sp.]|nr:EI24 domain-containing protein [Croceibacterium sp.]